MSQTFIKFWSPGNTNLSNYSSRLTDTKTFLNSTLARAAFCSNNFSFIFLLCIFGGYLFHITIRLQDLWPSRRMILPGLLNNNKLCSVSQPIPGVSWIFKKPVPMHWVSLDSLWHKMWLQDFLSICSSNSESITNGTFVDLTSVSLKSSSFQGKHCSQNWQNTIFSTF